MSNLVEKDRKFMFDLNIFDEGHVEEVEEEIPPPPTFSEEELEAARAEGFARGKSQGLMESGESREQYIAQQLEKVVAALPGLFNAERAREKLYERESIALSLAILRTLFPLLNERHGLDEVMSVIGTVLRGREEQSEIIIEVAEDIADEIRSHIETILPRMSHARIEVKGNPALKAGACQMFWKDGGAVRNAEELAAEIGAALERMLARGATSGQNDDIVKDAAGNADRATGSQDGEKA